MQKTIIRLGLLIKAFLKDKSLYLMIIAMLLLCLAMSEYQNHNDIIYNNAGIYVENADIFNTQLKDKLENENGFIEYNNREDLLKDINNGNLSCGFVLKDDISRLNYEDMSGYKIEFISTTKLSDSETFKETLFNCFLGLYNDTVIKELSSDIFENSDDTLNSHLIDLKNEYMSGDSLFSISIEYQAYEQENSKYGVAPIRGIIALCIHMTILLMGLSLYDENKGIFINSFSSSERNIVIILYFLSGALPVSIFGMIIQTFFTISSFNICDIVKMLVLICESTLLSFIMLKIIKRRKTYNALIIAFLPLNLLICPIIINIEKYIPSLIYIKYLFPVNIYL